MMYIICIILCHGVDSWFPLWGHTEINLNCESSKIVEAIRLESRLETSEISKDNEMISEELTFRRVLPYLLSRSF